MVEEATSYDDTLLVLECHGPVDNAMRYSHTHRPATRTFIGSFFAETSRSLTGTAGSISKP